MEAVKLAQFMTPGYSCSRTFALSRTMVVGGHLKPLPPAPKVLLGNDLCRGLSEAKGPIQLLKFQKEH